jgi:ABC-type transport system substrate-binding protein
LKLRKTVAALLLTAVVPIAAACGTTAEAASTTSSTADSSTSTSDTSTDTAFPGGGPGGGGPGGIDVSSVTTEEQLVELVQEAYGDAGLGLHRGHQPVEDVLDEVLTISHDELHVRMDAGQNLAAVAEDLGVDPQTLIDGLVESWSPAIDDLLAAGTITEDEAEQYRAALEEAFTFRVNWDGEEATPTFTGLDA